MKNLEQIRARNALRCQQETKGSVAGQDGGNIIKKIPTLVMNHGLLGTAANAFEANNSGMRDLFDHIARHLADKDINILKSSSTDLEKMMTELTEGDSNLLRKATNEAMAWLTYARRFVKKA
jgi:CRISPR/Cas system CMR-associated protein Cmr5 small subunit